MPASKNFRALFRIAEIRPYFENWYEKRFGRSYIFRLGWCLGDHLVAPVGALVVFSTKDIDDIATQGVEEFFRCNYSLIIAF